MDKFSLDASQINLRVRRKKNRVLFTIFKLSSAAGKLQLSESLLGHGKISTGSDCLYLLQFILFLRVRLLVLGFTFQLFELCFITSEQFSENIPTKAPIAVTAEFFNLLLLYSQSLYLTENLASGWKFKISENTGIVNMVKVQTSRKEAQFYLSQFLRSRKIQDFVFFYSFT